MQPNSKPAIKSVGFLANFSSALMFAMMLFAKHMGYDVAWIEALFADPSSMGALPEVGFGASLLGLLGRLRAKLPIVGWF